MNVALVFVFIFGAIIGSFLNVVILRFNTGKNLQGRSGCFSCGKELNWKELVPIFSFFYLNGRCSGCKSKISLQYPLVELATGFLFVFLFVRFEIYNFLFIPHSLFLIPFSFLLSLIIWSTLVVIFVYDLRHKIIPDLLSAVFFICSALLVVATVLSEGSWGLLWHHLISAVVLAGFFFFLWLVSAGRWMGFGDVKLSAGIGLYLGLAQGLSAIAYAFWVGAFYSLSYLAFQKLGTTALSKGEKALTMKSEVPFAPFLVLGTLLAYILGSDVFHVIFFLNV